MKHKIIERTPVLQFNETEIELPDTTTAWCIKYNKEYVMLKVENREYNDAEGKIITMTPIYNLVTLSMYSKHESISNHHFYDLEAAWRQDNSNPVKAFLIKMTWKSFDSEDVITNEEFNTRLQETIDVLKYNT